MCCDSHCLTANVFPAYTPQYQLFAGISTSLKLLMITSLSRALKIDSPLAGEDIPYFLYKLKVHYNFQNNSPSVDYIVGHLNSIHAP
jgi:hypothetical protein